MYIYDIIENCNVSSFSIPHCTTLGQDSNDWIIDSNGLYVATRSFLTRCGYCCANQCRNCPYINWRNSPTWTGITLHRWPAPRREL